MRLNLQKGGGVGDNKYLDMLCDVFVILLLVFKAPVTGVAKIRKFWLLLFVLLWMVNSCSQQIKNMQVHFM